MYFPPAIYYFYGGARSWDYSVKNGGGERLWQGGGTEVAHFLTDLPFQGLDFNANLCILEYHLSMFSFLLVTYLLSNDTGFQSEPY